MQRNCQTRRCYDVLWGLVVEHDEEVVAQQPGICNQL
jgi:hypothetical protein